VLDDLSGPDQVRLLLHGIRPCGSLLSGGF